MRLLRLRDFHLPRLLLALNWCNVEEFLVRLFVVLTICLAQCRQKRHYHGVLPLSRELLSLCGLFLRVDAMVLHELTQVERLKVTSFRWQSHFRLQLLHLLNLLRGPDVKHGAELWLARQVIISKIDAFRIRAGLE